jgi:hypothetical protein
VQAKAGALNLFKKMFGGSGLKYSEKPLRMNGN